jgi:Raf kinase inhibitor-like YbhB/YbcL family protein
MLGRIVGLFFCFLITAIVLFGGACSSGEKETDSADGSADMNIRLTSAAFEDGKSIPVKYTCDAENLSPPLEWSNIPEGTRSFAIICDDPDAPRGTWVHWVLFDIPAEATGLEEGVRAIATLPNFGTHGVNDFGETGYGGPCPPPGGPHRYFFKIYALDAKLELKAAVTKKVVLRAMKNHVLGEGRLMGKYKR